MFHTDKNVYADKILYNTQYTHTHTPHHVYINSSIGSIRMYLFYYIKKEWKMYKSLIRQNNLIEWLNYSLSWIHSSILSVSVRSLI